VNLYGNSHHIRVIYAIFSGFIRNKRRMLELERSGLRHKAGQTLMGGEQSD